MIFIVKDEHNETRDRVRACLRRGAYVQLHMLTDFRDAADDCETRYEHPHEPAERKH